MVRRQIATRLMAFERSFSTSAAAAMSSARPGEPCGDIKPYAGPSGAIEVLYVSLLVDLLSLTSNRPYEPTNQYCDLFLLSVSLQCKETDR